MYNFDIYLDLGYESRDHYLNSLSANYFIDRDIVINLANILGEEEDFDRLIDMLDEMKTDTSIYESNNLTQVNDECSELIRINDESIF